MKHFRYRIDGDNVQIRVIENTEDFEEARRFAASAEPYTLGFDTETTGLELFSDSFRVRTIQLGNTHLAYVLVLESARDHRARTLISIASERGIIIHNAPYDLLACDSTGLARLEDMQDHYHDTKIMAHLIDPRGKMDGGTGFGLKDLSAVHVDPNSPDTQNDLKHEFRKINATLKTGWGLISTDNPTYLLYAGLDPILTARLHAKLRRMVNDEGYGALAREEHAIQRVTTRMKRRGFKIDVPYGLELSERLKNEENAGKSKAKDLGLANMNSPKQVVAWLLERDWVADEFTDTGNPKVDKSVLEQLTKHDSAEVRTLAQTIIDTKRASKWRTAYVEGMLEARDNWDHVHPDINSLQARTGRMSISNPALQQLPSRGDLAWIIRRMVVADEGMVIGSSDYDQIEFRVLAALADVKQMKYAIEHGIDLHDYTAQLLYGDGFTKGQRSIGKGVGFGKVFGGGAKTLARQTGADIGKVREAIKAYDNVYPELVAYANKLNREQRSRGGYIINHHGRYMPLDQGRLYAAVNYSVQSIARDILARSLLRMVDAGLDEYLLLPVHDEVLFQAPKTDIADVARTVGDVMTTMFEDVPVSASGEVYGKSWAQGYVFRDEHGTMRSKGSKNEIEGWIEP